MIIDVDETPRRSAGGAPIVVADSVAARQWEAYLAHDAVASGATAWVTPAIAGYREWAESLWIADLDRPQPLGHSQVRALWQRIVAESRAGAELIGSVGAAEWAAEAWEHLRGAQVDPRELRASADQADFRAFLDWCHDYREWLDSNDSVDHAEIDARLPTSGIRTPARLIAADLVELSPARAALLHRLEADGCRVEHWAPPKVGSVCSTIGLADGAAELHAAARWARSRLELDATRRVALVVAPEHQSRRDVERVLANEIAPELIWQSGPSHALAPLLGAALTALELVGPSATFATFSRWSRNPLLESDPAERSTRALLEGRLRRELGSQLPFAQAYRRAGLGETLRRDAPRAARAIDAAFAEVGVLRRATPSRWAKLWQRVLPLLGWTAATANPEDPAVRAWHAALDELARLTAIVGAIDQRTALETLERMLQHAGRSAPPPLAGVHVFARVDQIGPGYDAAWITGFTDGHWPQPARSNPLLPRRLQREHGIPWCSPQDARDRSDRSLRRLLERVPEVVISWPMQLFDHATAPSPALRSFPPLHDEAASGARKRPRVPARARETVVDPAPALDGDRLVGSVGALNRQARCPLRAFCEYRLGARELEAAVNGLPARLFGIAAHRALELLLGSLPAQAALVGVADRAAVDRCVERALAETFGATRESLHALFELERERLASRLAELVHNEVERAPFVVAAVEQQQLVRIGRWALRVRIDRLDRLADGGIAIIDYKTGASTTSASWFKERLRDVQVPVYAVAATEPVAAAVLAQLGSDGSRYAGIWQASFGARRGAKLPDGRSWQEQLVLWREQILELIEEYAAGDTRLFTADLDDARGAYTPLTRVAEQLALHDGLLVRW